MTNSRVRTRVFKCTVRQRPGSRWAASCPICGWFRAFYTHADAVIAADGHAVIYSNGG